MKLSEALMQAQVQLAAISDSARLDAELLMAHVTGLNRTQQFVRSHDAVSVDELTAFQALIARRAQHEPVAYLTGRKGFWTLDLKVSPDVLVPRPETELLVEWALELVRDRTGARIADLGTGSGCIALALASERPNAEVLAMDISPAALAIAAENAKRLGINNVRFVEADFSEALDSHLRGNDACFDLIVSNPPYIAHDDAHLAALGYEPLSALTDGADGLQALRAIITQASSCLTAKGWLLLEHGYDQGTAVRALLAQHGYADITTRRDLAGHERVTGAQRG